MTTIVNKNNTPICDADFSKISVILNLVQVKYRFFIGLFSFYIILIPFAVQSQLGNCNISFVDNELKGNLKSAIVKLTAISEEGKVEVKYIINLSEKQVRIFTNEPFYCNADLLLNDSVISSTSSFLITNDSITIFFKNLPEVSIVSGGENDFLNKHRLLMFALPYKIGSYPGFSASLVKNKYELNIPDMRLRYYWQEYENNIIEDVLEKNDYYFILESLIEVQDFLSLKTLEKCYSLLADTLKKTSRGKEFKEYIEVSKKLLIGQAAPDFYVLDIDEKKIHSNNIYSSSKYTLIDFWASWCVPCRVQMKELKELYAKTDTTKFQIVSVSIDGDKDKWLKASREEGLSWMSYYDPGGWEGEVSKTFNLTYIPQNRIIDSSGNIVAFDLWGENLMQFLKQQRLMKNDN